jgi:membrane protein DedA with SNARE-associated domain
VTAEACDTIAEYVRAVVALKTLLIAGVAFALHHRFHGPPIDYLGLAAAAAASWVGIPGPGEPVLIAAGVFAARHRLDIWSVVVIAWAAAAAGGVAGWLIGMKAGRAVLTTRGPLHGARRRALARGDEVFRRWPVVAILLTPSWIAGIHRVRARVYLPTNAAGAALWAVVIGVGAYLVGPAIVDVANDLGWVSLAGLGALIVVGVALEIARRRRRRGRGGGAGRGGPPGEPATSDP